jgi:hypothetical protein
VRRQKIRRFRISARGSLDLNLFPESEASIGAQAAAKNGGTLPAVGSEYGTIVEEVWRGALDTFGLLLAGGQANELLNRAS